MYLTDEEKRILDGMKGDIAQKCMEFLVAYGLCRNEHESSDSYRL